MNVTCQECEREVAYREIEVHTVLEDEEFRSVHRCPYCEAEMENVAVS